MNKKKITINSRLVLQKKKTKKIKIKKHNIKKIKQFNYSNTEIDARDARL